MVRSSIWNHGAAEIIAKSFGCTYKRTEGDFHKKPLTFGDAVAMFLFYKPMPKQKGG